MSKYFVFWDDVSKKVGYAVDPGVTLMKDKFVSHFVDLGGTEVGAGAWQIILDRAGNGIVEEFQVRSPNTNFRVEITVDGTIELDKTYDQLRAVQQNSRTISAFAERDEDGDLTGYYVASIRDVSYYVSILVRVQNTGGTSTTFSQLFLKHHTRA